MTSFNESRELWIYFLMKDQENKDIKRMRYP
jgi:hypothetical protein